MIEQPLLVNNSLGYQKKEYKEQNPANIQAAELMGKLHDRLFVADAVLELSLLASFDDFKILAEKGFLIFINRIEKVFFRKKAMIIGYAAYLFFQIFHALFPIGARFFYQPIGFPESCPYALGRVLRFRFHHFI